MQFSATSIALLFASAIAVIAVPVPSVPSEEQAPDDYLGGFFKRDTEEQAPTDYLGGFFKRDAEPAEVEAPGDYLGGFFKERTA
ncbi:hypothetical protein G7Y89_g3061 [Cudoniella acicularis]|uniref:Uncharacterized protein n=1 Tax=Cudoniella acicularis TaxID=354080 RepID=A0A8H4RTX9_9HELO|nr:hypothetical protein G7Y89_g3061 [Cudoniella acicularis]